MNVKLLVVQGRPQGKSLVFPRGDFLFGRGTECDIRPNSDWVSRQHCMLRVTDDGAAIRDLGSRNGTLVNGKRVVGERNLQQGDLLQVGPLVFEVHLEDGEWEETEDPRQLGRPVLPTDETRLFGTDVTTIHTVEPEPAPGRVDPQPISPPAPVPTVPSVS